MLAPLEVNRIGEPAATATAASLTGRCRSTRRQSGTGPGSARRHSCQLGHSPPWQALPKAPVHDPDWIKPDGLYRTT